MSATQRKVRSREYDDYSISAVNYALVVKNLPYFLLNLLQIIKPFIRPSQGIAISTHQNSLIILIIVTIYYHFYQSALFKTYVVDLLTM